MELTESRARARIADVPASDAPEALYKVFGECLARIRAERGVSQEDLGTFAGLTRASIANIEKGRQRVMLHQLYRFADFLHVPLSDLLPDLVKARNVGLLPDVEAAYLRKLKLYALTAVTAGSKRRKRA